MFEQSLLVIVRHENCFSQVFQHQTKHVPFVTLNQLHFENIKIWLHFQTEFNMALQKTRQKTSIYEAFSIEFDFKKNLIPCRQTSSEHSAANLFWFFPHVFVASRVCERNIFYIVLLQHEMFSWIRGLTKAMKNISLQLHQLAYKKIFFHQARGVGKVVLQVTYFFLLNRRSLETSIIE